LPPKPAGSIQLEVHFDFDLNGILTVTATEKGKGQQERLVVNNIGVHRLSSHEIQQARAELETLFETDETIEMHATDASAVALNPELAALVERAQVALKTLDNGRAEELQDLLDQIESAASKNSEADLEELQAELEDFLYYASTDADS